MMKTRSVFAVAVTVIAFSSAVAGLRIVVSDTGADEQTAPYLSALKSVGHDAVAIPYSGDTNALREAVRQFV